jgi:intracellular septation protein A
MKTKRQLWLGRRWTALEFALKNFATPVAFFFVFELYGAKPAIAIAIGVTVLQLIAHGVFRLKISPFFIVASGFTVIFGTLDLLIHAPKFFKFEPFAQNLVLGIVFLVSVFTPTPIAAWFVAALPAQLRLKMSSGGASYLKKLTGAWAIYFLIKSSIFLYLAFTVNLGRLVVLRTLIGGASLALMVGGEMIYRRNFWRPQD